MHNIYCMQHAYTHKQRTGPNEHSNDSTLSGVQSQIHCVLLKFESGVIILVSCVYVSSIIIITKLLGALGGNLTCSGCK